MDTPDQERADSDRRWRFRGLDRQFATAASKASTATATARSRPPRSSTRTGLAVMPGAVDMPFAITVGARAASPGFEYKDTIHRAVISRPCSARPEA